MKDTAKTYVLTENPDPWEILWDQILQHYGDIRKRETSQQFLDRMKTLFVLQRAKEFNQKIGMKDTAKNNERFALFMGWSKRETDECETGQFYLRESAGSQFIMYNHGGGPRFDLWHPHENLGQLFQVVDAIKERGEMTAHSQEPKGVFQFWFSKGLLTFYFEKPTREEAIYAACLSAIDHIEKTKVANQNQKS